MTRLVRQATHHVCNEGYDVEFVHKSNNLGRPAIFFEKQRFQNLPGVNKTQRCAAKYSPRAIPGADTALLRHNIKNTEDISSKALPSLCHAGRIKRFVAHILDQ